MRLQVISATDSHPRYATCVKWFSAYWTQAARHLPCDVDIKIYRVTRDSAPSDDFGGIATRVDPRHLPSGFVAQAIRVLAGAWADADVVMTTDIDMMPLNQRATVKMLRAWSDSPERFVIGRDVLPPGQHPICYNLASPPVWAKLWSHKPEPGSLLDELGDMLGAFGGGYDSQHGGVGWHIDQEFLYSRLHETATPLTLLTDCQTGHRRLDRGQHPFPVNWALLPLAGRGAFTDYHVHHPVTRHRVFLATLLGIVRLLAPAQTLHGTLTSGEMMTRD